MMPVTPKSWGYVYIVRTMQRYKIGWSGTIPKLRNRLNRLNLMNGYGIDPILIIRSRRAHKIESDLHNLYSEKHHHGEWYCLNQDDIETIRDKHFRNIYTAQELEVW